MIPPCSLCGQERRSQQFQFEFRFASTDATANSRATKSTEQQMSCDSAVVVPSRRQLQVDICTLSELCRMRNGRTCVSEKVDMRMLQMCGQRHSRLRGLCLLDVAGARAVVFFSSEKLSRHGSNLCETLVNASLESRHEVDTLETVCRSDAGQ